MNIELPALIVQGGTMWLLVDVKERGSILNLVYETELPLVMPASWNDDYLDAKVHVLAAGLKDTLTRPNFWRFDSRDPRDYSKATW